MQYGRAVSDVEELCSRLRYAESERTRLLGTIEKLKSTKSHLLNCFWTIERMQDNVGEFGATKRYVLSRMRAKVKEIDAQIKTDKAAFNRMQKIAKGLVHKQVNIQ